jgi:hypothetical protein
MDRPADPRRHADAEDALPDQNQFPPVRARLEEHQQQGELHSHPSYRQSGAAMRDSTAGNRVDLGPGRVRGTVVGGDQVQHKKYQFGTGGLLVAVVAVVALLVISNMATLRVSQFLAPAPAEQSTTGAAPAPVAAPQAPLATDATYTPAAPGSVRHQGRLTMVPGPGFDLDAPATDPKWGVIDLADIFPGPNHRIGVSSSARALFLGAQQATYALCSSTTVMVSSTGIDSGQAVSGNSFCMKTTGDRYAGVRIIGLNGDATTIEITVWDPPDRS